MSRPTNVSSLFRRGGLALPTALQLLATEPVADPSEDEPCLGVECESHDHYVGGQAVLEGVMMRGRHSWGLSVRQPNGNVATHSYPLSALGERYPFLKWPVLRGMVSLGESLYLGIHALTLSANLSLAGDESTDREPQQLSWREMAFTLGIAMLFAVGLFVALPLGAAKLFEVFFGLEHPILFNLAEGIVRVLVFFAYLGVITLLPDLRRVFEYHGAEHKAIHSFEAGNGLDIKKALRFSTLHPRCGTAFLLVVMIMAVVVFTFIGKPSFFFLVLSRIVGIPLVAGLSYEVIRYAGRHKEGIVSRILLGPGLLLQRLTTREPSEDQVEVAVSALGEVLRVEAGGAPVPYVFESAPILEMT